MTRKRVVLITGSNGYLGKHLVNYLAARGHTVVAASRSPIKPMNDRIIPVQVPDLRTGVDWRRHLSQCEAVVHLAGVAHRLADEQSYNLINIQGTASLAQAARDCDIKQFVFVSSIAAQCGSFSDHLVSEELSPKPSNAYGRSKLAAEDVVRAAGVPYTILRPVVIYGGGEKGNFALMSKTARLPVPLPFGSLKAPRSVLSINNFNSAVDFVLMNPDSIGETIIVSDPTAVSVADMVTAFRSALNRPPNLFPVPEKWMERVLKSLGYGAVWKRLGAPLVAPPNKLLCMGWKPVDSVFSPSATFETRRDQ
jgi:nucleoside-diphosphate-sugar epimerase